MNRYLTEAAAKKRGWEVPVGILSVIMSAISVEVWIEDSPADEDPTIWLLAHIAVTGLMLWPLLAVLRRWRRRSLARRIANKLAGCGRKAIGLHEIDAVLDIKNSAAKIEDLKRLGLLQRIESDGLNLLLDGAEAAVETEAAPGPEAEPGDVIAQIRRLNDEIDDAPVSARIERIERATAGILSTLEARPERAEEARRFMSYYLPTTMKLLESYRLMEKQSFQGENILASRRSIEAVLDKLAAAAEGQQDRLFRSEALDVETDIRVLETMLAADGLTRPGEGMTAGR